MKEYEKTQSLKITVLTRVSAHGNGLYLYLPKDITEAYGINAGNKLEVQLLGHFRLKREEEAKYQAPKQLSEPIQFKLKKKGKVKTCS